jgi:AP-2 complex subunit alpha
MSVLSNGATRPVVRKKAALCLLRLIRKAPPDVDIMPASDWAGRLAAMLEERDPGLLLGLTTLLIGVVSRNYEGYEVCVPRMVHILERLKARDVSQDHTYYGLASPWLQVRTLRVLQYFPPPEDPAVLRALTDTLQRTLAGNEAIKNPNKSNAVHAIVFEAASLAVGLGDPELLNMAVGLLARFLTVRESNLKYLALENMGRLAQAPEVAEAVARHQKTVVACLHDPDVSMRRRALDLVFTTATTSTAPGVVDELLRELPHADYSLREELVLKAAVLAERFPLSSEWYVDSMLRLMEAAGDTVVDDVWHSVVQLVAGEQQLQKYAAEKIIEALRRGTSADVFLRCAAFILGEHGKNIAGSVPLKEQFTLLHARFPAALPETKAMMLTAYEKLQASAGAGDVELKTSVGEVLDRYSSAADAELQQRAVEYRGLSSRPDAAAVALQPLPPWEKRASLLLRRLAEKQGDGEDESREQPAWLQEAQQENEAVAAAAEEAVTGVAVDVPPAAAETTSGEGTSPNGAVVASPAVVIPDLLSLLDLEDDSSGLFPATTTSPTGAAGGAVDPSHQSTNNPALDALSGLSVPVAASANPFAEPHHQQHHQQHPATTSMAIEPIGDVTSWLTALCQSNSGILYEDPNLQVGVKMTSESGSSHVKVDLYLGNKNAHGNALARLVCSTPPSPAFALALGAPPLVLEPGRQVQLPLEATCLTPFTRPPVLQLGYSIAGSGGQGTMARTLDLPLVVTKFCAPVEVPTAVFTTRWAQVVGAPFKLSQNVVCRGGEDDVGRLLSVLQLQVLPKEVDPTPGTVAAACVFHCGMPPQTRQIPCMVKIEGLLGAGAPAVLTVATADAMVTDALKAELAQQLSRLG